MHMAGTTCPSHGTGCPCLEKEHSYTWQVCSEGLQVTGLDQVSPFSGWGPGKSVLQTDAPGSPRVAP